MGHVPSVSGAVGARWLHVSVHSAAACASSIVLNLRMSWTFCPEVPMNLQAPGGRQTWHEITSDQALRRGPHPNDQNWCMACRNTRALSDRWTRLNPPCNPRCKMKTRCESTKRSIDKQVRNPRRTTGRGRYARPHDTLDAVDFGAVGVGDCVEGGVGAGGGEEARVHGLLGQVVVGRVTVPRHQVDRAAAVTEIAGRQGCSLGAMSVRRKERPVLSTPDGIEIVWCSQPRLDL
jgi:hypothetical protein